MKIKMLIELEVDNNFINFKDKEEKDWLYNDILKSKLKNDLFLHSNEIGDEVGIVKVIGLIN